MKRLKKALITLLACASFAVCAIGLTACVGGTEESPKIEPEQSGAIEESGSSEKESSAPEIETYFVTYDANGGVFADKNTAQVQTVEKDAALMAPDSPKRTGYTFSGWATDPLGISKWNFASDKVTANVTLYAVWTQESAVILSVDGARIEDKSIFMPVNTSTDSVSLADKIVCSEDSVWKLYYDKLGQTEIPTRIAAGFNGELSSGKNIFYVVVTSNDGSKVNVYELDVFRSFRATVNYYDGETLLKTEEADAGYEYTASYEKEIEGYTVQGWNTLLGGAFTTETLMGDLDLFADKTANAYTVTYDVNGGQISSTSKEVTYDGEYGFDVPTRKGYIFLGWECDGKILTDEQGVGTAVWSIDENVTAVASWKPIDYTLTLKTDSADAALQGEGLHGFETTVEAVAPDLIGYDWLGWYEGDTLVSGDLHFLFEMPAKDLTYTARYRVAEAFAPFTFTSTETTCKITGLQFDIVGDIVVPSGVTEIGRMALTRGDLTKITSITIPKSVEKLGGYQYYDGPNVIKDLYYEGDIVDWCKLTETLPEALISSIYGYGARPNLHLSGEKAIDLVVSGVTKIPAYAFAGFNIRSVTFSDDVTEIGERAFWLCEKLVKITLGKNVSSIGKYAFAEGWALEIYNKSALPITAGSEEYGGIGLKALRITSDPSESKITLTQDGFALYTENEEVRLLNYCGDAKSVVIPSTVTVIEARAFQSCNTLEDVTIPLGITSIGDATFGGCSELKSVVIPEGLTTIGSSAFV